MQHELLQLGYFFFQNSISKSILGVAKHMLKIAICDDDIFIRKELESIIQNYCEYLQYEYDIFPFCDAETLLKTISITPANKYGIYNYAAKSADLCLKYDITWFSLC